MGYQETYIFAESEESLKVVENLINKAGEDYYEAEGAKPVVKMKFPEVFPIKSLEGVFAIYVVGDRYLQRSLPRLLNTEWHNIPEDVYHVFTEEIDPTGIWKGDKQVSMEEFHFD